ncbi:MAG: peptide ABC transporter permease [Anaerolineaceae bacterium]|nr:peptide ABC transporter permease [Anaerolineaceae bacterium]
MTTATTPNNAHNLPDPLEEIDEGAISIASPRQLMWWKFKKHKIAVFSVIVLVFMYLMAIFAGFISPYDPNTYNASYKYVPPMTVTFLDGEGNFTGRPGVHGLIQSRDPETLRITYETDYETWYPLHFFVEGEPYKLFGFIDTNVHLFGLGEEADGMPFFWLGSDRLGRDMFSRVTYGSQVSLSIGLVAVFLSLALGIVLGGISGYYGGWVDNVIQRIIEFIRSVPSLPLWMALSAALPPELSQEARYFGITIILSVIGWTSLGRQVRGRFLALRTEDFVLSARLSGASDARIIVRHMVPSFTSHIIASLTLSIPGIILAETSLSFLGLGLRQPAISWGVLLQEAQNIRTVALAPWLLLPGLAVVFAVLAFNFLGDGLRDAADPFSR